MIPTPKRSLFFNDERSSINQFSFEIDPEIDYTSPTVSKRDPSSKSRPRLHNADSTNSSRTTSNLSISSINSISSVSSVDTISSSTTNSVIRTKKSFRRSKTYVEGASASRILHSYSASNIDYPKASFSNDYDNDDNDFTLNNFNNNDLTITDDLYEPNSINSGASQSLDFLCVPSPIAERSFNLELDDESDQENKTQLNVSGGLNKREIGSPLQKRPIKSKVRRTHSMFYSKKEITDTTNMFGNLMTKKPPINGFHNQALNNEDFDGSVLSNSVLEQSKIETFNVKNDLIPRIKVETFCKILDGYYREYFEDVVVVDCRFEYEYQGGHINGAVNVSSQQELENKFLNAIKQSNNFLEENNKKNTLIVFHCEFSSYRGPLMASHLRTCDRNKNQENYPHLDYPNILVLEGGYKSFFDLQSHRCFPQKYVEMNDNNHKNACEKELTRFRRDLKRANSYGSLTLKSSSSTSSVVPSHPKLPHRRTMTSINFPRRPSLKSQFLDFSRSSLDLVTDESEKENELEDDRDKLENENGKKPPEIINFGFKFPVSKPITAFTNDQDSPSVFPQKKKLSRAFTTYNM